MKEQIARAVESLRRMATNGEYSSHEEAIFDGIANLLSQLDKAEREGWVMLAKEFAKPQFMTTTSGGGQHSLEFTFSGDDGRERRDALHNAMIAAAQEPTP